jgi:hypothetical protein
LDRDKRSMLGPETRIIGRALVHSSDLRSGRLRVRPGWLGLGVKEQGSARAQLDLPIGALGASPSPE